MGSDTMSIGIALTSKKRCQPCIALRKQRMKLSTKIGGKALPHLGGDGKIPGGIPHLRHHHDDGLDTDRTEKPAKISESSIYLWNESHNEFGAKITVIDSVTANTVYCHRRGVQRVYLQLQETGYENCISAAWTTTRALRTSMTQTTSTTNTMTRTPTRASCTTCEHALRARSLRHTLMMCHMHLMAQGVLESHLIHVHSHT